jgi:two-component system, OmpR family, response regulator
MKVLIVEDDAATASYLIEGLGERGHESRVATTGRAGLEAAIDEQFDAIVLDRMLPEMDGLSVIKALRARGVATPVLFLTNLSGLDDRVEGLEAGGDDYLVKPFALTELMARLTALTRRQAPTSEPTVLTVLDLEMDLIRRTVRRGGEPIDLQPREFQLLEELVRNEGQVVTRSMLLEKIWDFHFDAQTNIVQTHICRLRAKVDRGQAVPLIHTLRGAGYCLRASP